MFVESGHQFVEDRSHGLQQILFRESVSGYLAKKIDTERLEQGSTTKKH